MKIRNDYVSNSSSSSFVIKENLVEAMKVFTEDFYETFRDNCEPLGESFNVNVHLRDEEWYSHPFVDVVSDIKDGKLDYNDISELVFDCDDWDSTAMGNMNFLYHYFQKLGFNPDATESERDFTEDGNYMMKVFNRLSKVKSN